MRVAVLGIKQDRGLGFDTHDMLLVGKSGRTQHDRSRYIE